MCPKIMNIELYIAELNKVADQLSGEIENVSISGEGIGSFIVANNNNYGIEIYRNKNNVIIDPSLNGELLGEKEYSSYSEAIENSLRWLTEGKL